MQIAISGLTKTFRNGTGFGNTTVALDGIDLTVTHGVHGLLGTNGAGKTTLLRILAGLLRPTAGRVLIGGNDLSTSSGRRAVRRCLGYLPQDVGVYPELTARQFLDYVALLKGLDDRSARRRRVSEMLEVVGLTPEAGQALKGFSGGMRRRVGIAQALLTDPRLLIVDEPTTGLDPVERIRFRTLLARLAGRRTVLLSTHIVEDVAQTCTDLTVLDKGRVRFRGTAADLVARGAGQVEPTLEDGYLALVCEPAPLDGIRS
ncbi:MAG: type transport system ATP-binding protein [Actinomycetota bacterium]|nr:type transport system ATP-binding protein [Actinomycetota bacterium]